jgi:hypothetical protein
MKFGPRHERVSLSPLRTSLGSGPERATKDISLPLGYPIGLAGQRKPVVKFSLIIVNAGVAMIAMNKASGSTYPDQNPSCKTLVSSGSNAARMPLSEA